MADMKKELKKKHTRKYKTKLSSLSLSAMRTSEEPYKSKVLLATPAPKPTAPRKSEIKPGQPGLMA